MSEDNFLKESKIKRDHKWSTFNNELTDFYVKKGQVKPQGVELITSLDDAMELINYILNKGFFFGTDYYNGWKFGNITSIKSSDEHLIITPDDLSKREKHLFKFKSLLIVHYPEEKKYSPSFFLETEKINTPEPNQQFYEETNGKGVAHFYTHMPTGNRYSEGDYNRKVEYDEIPYKEFNSECHFFADGISAFLNVQGMDYMNGGSFLYDLQNRDPFLTNKKLEKFLTEKL